MTFALKLLVSRARRQKSRLALVALAIAASSCLIVWTIGGYQALFIDATINEANYLGRYDLVVAPEIGGSASGGGPSFGGPFARATKEEKPAQTPAKPKRGGGKRGASRGIPTSLADELRADPDVAFCDATGTVRAFVYAPGMERSILEDPDADDEGAKPTAKRSLEIPDDETPVAPEGIDPELHRRAFAAYRATMGTPTGLGSDFLVADAEEPPFELKIGRWLAPGAAREAVLTERGAEKMRAGPGDKILVFFPEKGAEYQLEIVGVVEDPNVETFYASAAFAEEALGGPAPISALWMKLRPDVDPAAVQARIREKLAALAPETPLEILTQEEIAERKTREFLSAQTFQPQATTAALLGALAAIFIVFTALNVGAAAQYRLFAFYRAVGLTRGQVALSVFLEALLLATPGWIFGMLAGWFVVFLASGKTTGINAENALFSFVCTVVGAILAAIYPMAKSAAARPLDAISIPAAKIFSKRERRARGVVFALLAIFGLACLATEIAIVQSSAPGPPVSPRDEAMNALLCLGLLTVGTIAPIPAATRLAEAVLTPVFAFVLRFDRRLLRNELSGNAGRVFAVSLALSVGGGLFVSTQIWGYSMLEPFLPQRETGLGAPEAFAAFLPNGLRPEIVEELKRTPEFKPGEFLPVAVEQAAFVADSIPEQSSRRAAFANVVFFGVDVDAAFGGSAPLVGFKFRQGSPKAAFAAVKNGRGVIVTDSLSVDYGLNLGDVVKVAHPRKPEKTLEYPIVGVVYFPGWQWLSKTGGVRRNFGRSGGIAFADAATIADDYQIERRSYFWFNTDGSRSYAETEAALDRLARRNLALDQADGLAARGPAQTAYVKLSTRDSLTDSISRRADSVIWGLSKTPLVTLAIASIAAFGAIANSVRARRWQFGAARAVGLTRGAIVRMVLAEAGLVAVLASGASFTFGLLAAQRALKLGRSMFGSVDPPLILPFEGLAVGFCAMAGLCLVAALYPALQTAREEPTALLQIGRDGAE